MAGMDAPLAPDKATRIGGPGPGSPSSSGSPVEPPRVPSAEEADAIASARAAETAPVGSLRSKRLQLQTLQTAWLGKLVPNFGQGFKASAVTLAACGAQAASGRQLVRFSKYSGIQEFADSVVLFVNVGGDSYANLFEFAPPHAAPTTAAAAPSASVPPPPGGRSAAKDVVLTWFARPRDRPDSPIIARLTSQYLAGRSDAKPQAKSESAAATTVGLFMRDTRDSRPGGKSSPPLYVWCGTLQLLVVDFAASPMRFRWRLQDSKELQTSEHFQQLIGGD
ncbi:hypothetical protein FNF27_00548 [Cafeteria roenbergensis]|uniref:Uncharacterized protein n=1 Tax=Cafeteria roenbergensis TaxID=33653 RepID=A0A5A8EPT0_CAFRO|nr:hypothetical protein FNF27_00548 [Cafeteria roenbergensis]